MKEIFGEEGVDICLIGFDFWPVTHFVPEDNLELLTPYAGAGL